MPTSLGRLRDILVRSENHELKMLNRPTGFMNAGKVMPTGMNTTHITQERNPKAQAEAMTVKAKKQQVKTANAKRVDRAVVDAQLGTNRDTKMAMSRQRIDSRKR
jgi:hypothetical protein